MMVIRPRINHRETVWFSHQAAFYHLHSYGYQVRFSRITYQIPENCSASGTKIHAFVPDTPKLRCIQFIIMSFCT